MPLPHFPTPDERSRYYLSDASDARMVRIRKELGESCPEGMDSNDHLRAALSSRMDRLVKKEEELASRIHTLHVGINDLRRLRSILTQESELAVAREKEVAALADKKQSKAVKVGLKTEGKDVDPERKKILLYLNTFVDLGWVKTDTLDKWALLPTDQLRSNFEKIKARHSGQVKGLAS